MPVRLQTLSGVALIAIATAGCIGPFAREARAPARPEPLVAAPTAPVMQSALPPPSGTLAAPAPAGTLSAAPSTGPAAGINVAAATPATAPASAGGNVDIGRTDLLGGWTLASGGDSCQLFMSLTTWSGGYRATTRGCSSAPLQGVSAWNLEGRQIMLLNDSGSTVARLYPTTKTQFSGLNQGGAPVTVSR